MDPYEAERKPSIIKPVLIGGIVGGVLGMIPGIFTCNFCCCLWYAVGGIISVLVYRSMAPYSLTAGMGGLLGLVSGLIAGVISSIGMYLGTKAVITNPDFYDPDSKSTQEAITTIRDMYSQAGIPESQVEEIVNVYYSFIANATPEAVMMNLIFVMVFITITGTIVSVVAGMITAAIAGKRERYPEEPPPYQP